MNDIKKIPIKRVYVPQDIKNIIKKSIIPKSTYKILGSYQRQSIKYPSDIDIEIIIKSKNKDEIFNDLIESVTAILSDNYTNLLTEIKIELLNGDKKKWEDPQNDLKGFYKYYKDNFKNISFIKFDYVLYYNELIELNIMYKLKDKEFEKSNYENDIKNDIKELVKEKDYYKALKRLYLIFELNNDESNMNKLINVFNSDLGKLNYDKKTLDMIELIKEKKLNNKYIDNAITNELKKLDNKNYEDIKTKIENQSKKIYESIIKKNI
jgi:predicted nucleotidyltransferase